MPSYSLLASYPARVSLSQKISNAGFAALLLLLLLAPLPFGSNSAWAQALIQCWVALLLLLWLLQCALHSGQAKLNSSVWRAARWPLMALLLVQLWVAAQLLPLPVEWLARMSPVAALGWSGVTAGPAPLSLDPGATVAQLSWGLALCGVFLLVLAWLDSPERLRQLLATLVVAGLVQALYGGLVVLTDGRIALSELLGNREVASGTFINRNHFAGFMVMALAAGIGLLFSQLQGGQLQANRPWRERLKRLLNLFLSSKIRLRIYLAIMVIALVMSRSRTGNTAFFVALGVAALLLVLAERRINPRLMIFLGSLLLVDTLIVSQWYGLDKVVERIEGTHLPTEGRRFSNEYTLDMLADFPLTGSGAGSFATVFANYQPQNLRGFWSDAHNDYLQFAVELGVPATLLLAAVVTACGVVAVLAVLRRRHKLFRGAGLAGFMVVVWLAIHSATDFNLQIPANSLLLVVLLALCWVAYYGDSAAKPNVTKQVVSTPVAGWRKVLLLVLAAVVAAGLVASTTQLKAALALQRNSQLVGFWRKGYPPSPQQSATVKQALDQLLEQQRYCANCYYLQGYWYAWHAYTANLPAASALFAQQAVNSYKAGLRLQPLNRRAWLQLPQLAAGLSAEQVAELTESAQAQLNKIQRANSKQGE